MQSDTLAAGTLVAGRYRIVRELGRGGMGAVYVVEHVNTGGLWALKVMLDCTRLQAERASRFRREARASARITSEHVVKVTDADTAPELDGAPFIVMELLDGQDVERLLMKRGRLEPREVVDILTQVARGLDKAHAAGVIHRDLKPENIFMHRREDGSTIVKVLDFGISKVLRPDGDMASASVTGATDVMGTPLYMAPEQATARHEQVGPPTDVWAIGLMAVRMLTGSVYWQGDTIAEVFVQIMSENRWPPSQRWPDLPAGFDAWFQKSTAPKGTARFQSVGEQVTELALLLTGEKPLLRSSNPADPTPPTNESVPAQLVTQVMSVSDKSSSRPMAAAIGVSTAEPVTNHAIPLQPARGLWLVAALLAFGVLIGGGFLFVRSRMTAGVTASTGANASGGSIAALPSATDSTLPPPVVKAASNDPASAAQSGPAQLTPAAPPPASASSAPGGPPGGAAGGVGAAQPALRPLRPAQPPPPVTITAASTPAPIAKPPAKPGDLFDTQK